MSEQMRKEFDVWFKSLQDSEYCGAHTKALLLECWQSSRQSLVVKLPIIDCLHSAYDYRYSAELALDSAGVRFE